MKRLMASSQKLAKKERHAELRRILKKRKHVESGEERRNTL